MQQITGEALNNSLGKTSMMRLENPGWCGIACTAHVVDQLLKTTIFQEELAQTLELDSEGVRPEKIAQYFVNQGLSAIWQQAEESEEQAFLEKLADLKKHGAQIILDIQDPDPENPNIADDGHYVIFEDLIMENGAIKEIVINDPNTGNEGGIKNILYSEFLKRWIDVHPDTEEILKNRALVIKKE